MDTLAGKNLGKYKVLERLGKGGMAEVYKAYHPVLDRFVTIKILYSHLAEGEDFLARFQREAKAIASLRHAHIVQIHDFDVIDNTYFMVMEFIDGGNLQAQMVELARRGAYMPFNRVLAIMDQVAEALDYAHACGIIHRDVKPSNILLDASGNAFLADFGISRLLSATQFTTTGALIGTPTYMSPEQGLGAEITPASDIYSLGVILYELLAGKVPFSADTTPLAIIHKQIYEPPPPPCSLRPDLPQPAEQVVLKALAKDPLGRYQSGRELVRALEQALPPDEIARPGAVPLQAQSAVADLPTEQMDLQELAGLAQTPAAPVQDKIKIETVAPLKITGTTPAPPAQPGKKPAQKGSRPALRNRLILFGILSLALIAALIFVFTRTPARTPCTSLPECVDQAAQARAQGDLPGFIDRMHAALDHVPADQEPPHANLWCDLGDVEKEAGQIDQARLSYQQCMAWTQNIAEFQPVRDRANAGLATLH
jgi:serine/threonine protein kinase